jgi:hypothetical protein
MCDQRAEARDGKRAAELAAPVQHAAGKFLPALAGTLATSSAVMVGIASVLPTRTGIVRIARSQSD